MLNGIFTNPAFGVEALTDSILQIPYMPTQARALGIFAFEGVPTTTVDLEYDAINMTIIPNTPRGGPIYNYRRAERALRNFRIPHCPLQDEIKPEAIQDVRQFGTPAGTRGIELQTAEGVVNRHLTGMAMSHDVTLEHMCVGAITGTIYDYDGSTVIYNLFNEFGIEQTVFDFDLGNDNLDIRHLCLQVKRTAEVALGAARIYSHLHCFCGNDWFDSFIQHPQVEDAYKFWQATGGNATWGPTSRGQIGDWLRADNRTGFPFAGIFFENYVGSVTGAQDQYVQYIPPGEAHFFPVGVPELFRGVFAPANMIEAANTIGLPRYARAEPLRMGRGIEIQTESNPLCYCTRPATLIKGISSTYPVGIGNDWIPGS